MIHYVALANLADGGGVKGLFGGAFSFFDELMPGLDFIPTFTIAWVLQYFRRGKPAQGMQIITR